MPDHFHSKKSHSGAENACCGAAAEDHAPESGTVPEFPDVKLTFSFSGFLLTGFEKFLQSCLILFLLIGKVFTIKCAYLFT